ncbi:uncharacterized protein LOC113552221 [Rhopalosiphum maidis]|uniref:uncharacterized protein LOC113552221 n=1 Tax=Rhopalosiphum maidis TaxID=43146 RepID=UPI000F00F8A1|nr:uncharacterized protein LOC113552221 [Rhopalosiphum maidis]
MAIPFNPPSSNPDATRDHYLRIQNLLKELLTLLRRMPSWMIGDQYANINMASQTPLTYLQEEENNRLWVQQQQRSMRAFHRRRLRERQHQERRAQQQELERQQQSEQQRPLLPDLVSSCGPSPRQLPPPPPPPPSAPLQQQQQPEQQQSTVDDDKFVGAVKLQVAVCPTCYYGKERKLKVIAVAKLDENGKPIRWNANRDDEELLVFENKSTKVKRRIMSLLQPSKIESSVLTAMFVIIGWKMFIKQ